ncbi:MAG: DUF116 domain-containing protein [Deltaproteobacteria bacterium]|nr:DUF116 domain-containing protein [Deltaproteobacteria bacterium]
MEDSRPQQRIFIGLLLFTLLILSGVVVLLWVVPYIGLSRISPLAPIILAVCLGILLFLVLLGVALLVLTIILGRDLFLSHNLRGLVVQVLFPFMVLVGKVVGISKRRVQQSFIAVNNQLVVSNCHRRIKPERILLLLPHCIQDFDCDVKITGNIKNCRKCGRCEIKDLLELADAYGVQIAVATGGTLARRIIVQNRPEAIVAVACELDLTTGIQDAYPLPVIGILNERPNGPCINTRVDIGRVREALLYFLENENPTPSGSGNPDSCRDEGPASG